MMMMMMRAQGKSHTTPYKTFREKIPQPPQAKPTALKKQEQSLSHRSIPLQQSAHLNPLNLSLFSLQKTG